MTATGMWRFSTSRDQFDPISSVMTEDGDYVDRMEKSRALRSVNENSALIRK